MLIVDGECSVEVGKRFLGATEIYERDASADQRFAAVTPCGECLVVDGERFFVPGETIEHRGEGTHRTSDLRVYFQSLADQPESLDVVALLLSQDTEPMQRVEMIGSCPENRAVELLGLSQHSQLMKLHGAFGRLRHDGVLVCRCSCHSRRRRTLRKNSRWFSRLV